ncbi:MAG: hypothetical protein JOZ62_13485, partial [Acidobacteriaceae bacterium]|nr:hypothetical protein [Acidobacteriaceae bacterium]
FSEQLATLPPPFPNTNADTLASASRGLTGADIKAVIEDAKLLFAQAKLSGAAPRPIENFFLDAMATLRATRRKYGKRNSHALLHSNIGLLAE